jgi:hypothetical protein
MVVFSVFLFMAVLLKLSSHGCPVMAVLSNISLKKKNPDIFREISCPEIFVFIRALIIIFVLKCYPLDTDNIIRFRKSSICGSKRDKRYDSTGLLSDK